MKRSVLVMLVSLVLICSLLLISCSSSTTSSTTTTTPTTTSAPPVTSTTSTAPPVTTTTTKPPTSTTQPPPPVTSTTAAPITTAARPAPTGTLKVAQQTFSYETFDQNDGEAFWGYMVQDPLVTYTKAGDYTGVLAESWALSPDGLQWTFKIRKNVKFTNGDPLTAQDVAFSIDHFIAPDSKNPWSPYLRNNFAGYSVPDDYTYIYKTKTPEPPLIISFQDVNILPKNYIQAHGWDYYKANPIGSGPWKLNSFTSKTQITFDVNMDYWGNKPYYAHVQELLVPEESTRIAMLKRGDVDIIGALSTDRTVELQAQGYTLQAIGLPTDQVVSWQGTWLTTGPTKDINFRKAMSYAINRQEMADTFYKGLAVPGGRWFMYPGSYGWDPTWKADPYDPALVKTLLAAAGYPSKFANPVITLIAQAGPYADFMQVLQGYWTAAGIQTKIKVVDTQGYLGLMFVRNTDPNGANVGDVMPWIYPVVFNAIYHSANMYQSNGVHSTGNDPQADALYKKATTELDPVKAKQYWTDFLNYGYGMWVNTGICTLPSYWVEGPKVGAWGD
ncbi:MAG TPA: ABC transporter substrate-binding protein, partial [Dehalococcoidales bacterium]